jgi:hypothetical protein
MDKNKKIVIAALGAALLGMGAFQFMGGGGEEPAPAKTEAKKEDPKKDEKLLANRVQIPPLGAKDPFHPVQLPGGVQPEDPKPVSPQENTGSQGSSQPIPKDIWGPGEGPFGPLDPNNEGDPNVPTQVEKPVFGYSLIGIISGDTPAAVFADQTGNQKLITLGGEIDGDSKLISIKGNQAVVKFKDETLKLTIGGTASAKF